jgi:hypothetical protein
MKSKLKFKYSQGEVFALKYMLERTVLSDKSKDIEGRLLLANLLSLYDKINYKTLEIKDKYTIAFTPAEAIAFYIYFANYEGSCSYEQRVVRIVIGETDKAYL